MTSPGHTAERLRLGDRWDPNTGRRSQRREGGREGKKGGLREGRGREGGREELLSHFLPQPQANPAASVSSGNLSKSPQLPEHTPSGHTDPASLSLQGRFSVLLTGTASEVFTFPPVPGQVQAACSVHPSCPGVSGSHVMPAAPRARPRQARPEHPAVRAGTARWGRSGCSSIVFVMTVLACPARPKELEGALSCHVIESHNTRNAWSPDSQPQFLRVRGATARRSSSHQQGRDRQTGASQGATLTGEQPPAPGQPDPRLRRKEPSHPNIYSLK